MNQRPRATMHVWNDIKAIYEMHADETAVHLFSCNRIA